MNSSYGKTIEKLHKYNIVMYKDAYENIDSD